MYSNPLTTIVTWSCLLTLATANLSLSERKGKYTLYRRGPSALNSTMLNDTSFFPFPANKSSIVDAGSQPADPPPGNLTVNDYTPATDGSIARKFIEAKCDADKKSNITVAWEEAKLLAKAQTTFILGYNYNIPHTQWLGPDWNSQSSWIPWKYNYRKLIGDNFARLARLYSNAAPKHDYIYWYCYDYGNQCTEGVQAYTWDSVGLFWSNHYTVFCDPFYKRSTLGDQIADYANDQNGQKVMENFHLSKAQIMFHETWHYEDLVSSPRTGDYAYLAQPVWDLAKNKGTSWAYVNGDSYALDAVAIYVQQYYKSSMSPVPWRELAKLDAGAAAATPQPPDDNATTVNFMDTPPGWIGPLSNTDTPDLSLWEEVFDDGSIATPPPSPSSIPPSVTPLPYATGTCSFHLNETQNCDPRYTNNLYGSVVMVDNNKNLIGSTDDDDDGDHPLGYAMDDGNPYSFTSKLPHPLVITGEHENDYVQFTYGSLNWQSKTPNGGASCTVGGWDPRDGPTCKQTSGDRNAVNMMDCSFPC